MLGRLQGRGIAEGFGWKAIIIAAITCLAGSAGAAADAALDGRRLYLDYCASCHGVSARGDGPDSGIFEVRPPNLRSSFLKLHTTADLVERVRVGKPLELAFDVQRLRARAAEVEALVAYMQRLPTVDWKLVKSGQEVFVSRCSLCHGWYGRPPLRLPGGVRRSRDLSDPAFQGAVGDKDLLTVVRHGRKGMPGLTPRITPDEAQRLVVFVRLLSPGFETYSQYCANCHGTTGSGAGEVAEKNRRPHVTFDRDYFAQRDAEQLRMNVWHMLADAKPTMPHYRQLLREAEARAIIDYLKRLP